MSASPSEHRKILVVDSDRATRIWLGALFERAGFHVETASGGSQLLSQIRSSPPHMLLLEATLDGQDGLDLCHQIRELPCGEGIWIVILSSKDQHEDIAAGLEAGADDYITKHPGAHNDLIAKAQTMMARDRPRHEAVSPEENGKSHGRIFSFYGAKGGSGITALAVNVGYALHELIPDQSILLADLVLPLGSIGPLVGFESKQTLSRLTNEIHGEFDRKSVARYISPERRYGMSVLLSANDLHEAQTLEVKRIGPLFRTLRTMFDYVCVDLGHALSRITMPVVEMSDLIFVIITPDINAVALTKISLDYFEKLKFPPERIMVIQNRTVPRVWMSGDDIERELNHHIAITLPYDGEQMPLATNSHVPYMERFPSTGVGMGIQDIAKQALSRLQTPVNSATGR